MNVSTLDAWRKTVTESGGDAEAFVMLFTDPLQFLDNLKGEIKGLLDSLLWDGAGDTVFSFLTSACKEITELWNGLEKLIDKVVGIALKGFGKISEAWQKVKRWFGMGKDEVAKAESEAQSITPAPPAQDMTYGGQVQLQAATSNPITSMTSNAIAIHPVRFRSLQMCGSTILRSRHRPPM